MNHPDLFALLRGELTNAEAMAAGVHLGDCDACGTELAELAVGNAMLARAARTVSEPRRTATPLPAVPPLSRRPSRRVPNPLVVAAAVVAVVAAGAVGVTLVDRQSDDDVPPGSAYVSVSLDPVTGSAAGEVRMVEQGGQRTRMTLGASDLPAAGRGHFYYAWLLDPETDKMLPLGQVDPSGTTSFDIDDTLLGSYSAIDVSLEDDDGDAGHSVTSVLRGSYDEDAPASPS